MVRSTRNKKTAHLCRTISTICSLVIHTHNEVGAKGTTVYKMQKCDRRTDNEGGGGGRV